MIAKPWFEPGSDRINGVGPELVAALVAEQFPQWAHLPVVPAPESGWDNRTFRLGDDMLVRLPSAAGYVPQIDKEHLWLPRLAPQLPLPIPAPAGLGKPALGYPWPWSIYRWLPGERSTRDRIPDLARWATDIAKFLRAFQQLDARDGPPAGAHSFFRGGPLSTYDAETRRAIAALTDPTEQAEATAVWDAALAAAFTGPPVWVHGDVAPGNLLVDRTGRLSAVIDFGCSAVGDPACDLVIAWTFLDGAAREAFRTAIAADAGTWARARGWAIWKALITFALGNKGNAPETLRSRETFADVIADHRRFA